MPAEQSAKSHTATDLLSHFILLPLTLFALIFSLFLLKHSWPYQRLDHLWMIAISLAAVLLNYKSRVYTLRVQDRVIMGEERTRLAGHAATYTLTKAQLIALRFASTEELPTLATRAAQENLTPTQIKQAIRTWRPDPHRV